MKKITWLPILLLIPNFVFGAGQDDLKEGKALLVAGDYDKAFPRLAKSGDKLLAPLAELELSKPTDFMATAAAYKDAVKKAPGPLKLTLVDRMVYWYGKQWAVSTDDKQKAELRKIFASIEPIPPGADKAPKQPSPLIAGWNEFQSKFGAYLDERVVRSGKRSAKLITLNPVSANSAFGSQRYPATGGKVYRYSAWVLSTADVDAYLTIRFFDNGGQQLKGGACIAPMDSPYWQRLVQDFEAPEGTFRMDLVLGVQNLRSGAIWLDDASVTVDGVEVLKNGGFEER